MKINKIEVAVPTEATNEAAEAQFCELNDVELAVVGGGGGDVVFA